jgi:hypothetical protein
MPPIAHVRHLNGNSGQIPCGKLRPACLVVPDQVKLVIGQWFKQWGAPASWDNFEQSYALDF